MTTAGKILVTGATGFVGSALVRRLVQQGAAVRIIARQQSDRKNIAGLPLEEVCGDILDRESILRAMKGCTQVYHVAGLYRAWMRDYRELQRVNVEGTRNVLEAALRSGVTKVVHTSSIAALGIRADGKPSDEQTAFNLFHLNVPYEISKHGSEQVAFDMAARGLPVVIVRPALVMGAGDRYPTPSGKMVLDVLKQRIPSFFDGGIDVVAVDDVAEGHVLAMQRGTAGDSYNLGCPGNFTSMQALFTMIAHYGGVSPPRLRVPYFMALAWACLLTAVADFITHGEPLATPGNIQILALKKRVDFSRAVRELGIPQTPLHVVVARTVNWYRSQGYV